jgi:hypothetical protein
LADLVEGTAKVQQAGDGSVALAVEQAHVLAGTAQQDGALGLFQGKLIGEQRGRQLLLSVGVTAFS